jgi:anti-anti-sigma factor
VRDRPWQIHEPPLECPKDNAIVVRSGASRRFFREEGTMNITYRRRGQLAAVEFAGRWSIGPGELEVTELQALVSRLIAAGTVHISFNLRRLDALDARGLAEIAQTHKRLQTAGGELVLIAPNRFVRKMLAVTRLDSVIAVRDGDEAARPRSELRCAPLLARVERAPG